MTRRLSIFLPFLDRNCPFDTFEFSKSRPNGKLYKLVHFIYMSLTFYAGSLFTPVITRCINNYLLKTLERNRSLLVNQHTHTRDATMVYMFSRSLFTFNVPETRSRCSTDISRRVLPLDQFDCLFVFL